MIRSHPLSVLKMRTHSYLVNHEGIQVQHVQHSKYVYTTCIDDRNVGTTEASSNQIRFFVQ